MFILALAACQSSWTYCEVQIIDKIEGRLEIENKEHFFFKEYIKILYYMSLLSVNKTRIEFHLYLFL